MSHEKLNSLTTEQIKKYLVKLNKEGTLVDKLSRILSSDKITVKLSFILQTLTLLEELDLVRSICGELTGLVLAYVSKCITSEVESFIEWFTEAIKLNNFSSHKSLAGLQSGLSRCATLKTVVIDGEVFTGVEGFDRYLNKICSYKWNRDLILPLIEALRDLTLSSEQLDLIIDKSVAAITTINSSNIPALIYQLLLISSKGKHKRVINGVIQNLHKLEKSDLEHLDNSEITIAASSEDFSQIEGTSLLHVNLAIKHDIELGKAVVANLKTNRCFTTFSLALGVALLSHPRFSENILITLKSRILKNLKTQALLKQSRMISTIMNKPEDVSFILDLLINRRSGGWEVITEGIVNLAFALLDINDNSDVSVADVGVRILERCYKVHSHCKSAILNQILNRIISSAQLPTNKHKKLLYSISRRSLQLMLSELKIIKDNLLNIPQIPPANANAVLLAIVPVMRYDVPLRDNAIMVFRKALFSKNPASRKIAVVGLTEMMRKFKVGEAYSQSSQLSCSQVQIHMMMTDDINEAVCTEIVLLLKRALKQQPSIRCEVYDRLPAVIVANHQLHPMILQLLEEQLNLSYEDDENLLPPLKLSDCITTLPDYSFLKEPLPNLLRAILHCTSVLREEEEDNTSISNLTDRLRSILVRTYKSDLEDWELDKSAQFGSTGSGSRNLITAQSLISILEVLLQNIIVNARGITEESDSIKKLFFILNNITEMLSEKQNVLAIRNKKQPSPTRFFSIVGIECLLRFLFVDDMSEHEAFCSTLRSTTNLYTWALGVTTEHLKNMALDHDNGNSKDNSVVLNGISHSLIANLSKPSSLYKDKTSGVLLRIVQIMKLSYFNKFQEFCESLTSKLDETFSATIFNFLIKSLEEENYDESQNYLSVLSVLHELDPSQKFLDWIKESIKFDGYSSSLTKDIIGILLKIMRESETDLDILIYLAEDIHSCLGDIEDEDYSLNNQPNYKIITENNAPRVCLVLGHALERIIHDIEWAIQVGCNEDQADAISIVMSKLAAILISLLQSQTPRGTNTIEQVGKITRNFYTTFTLFIKHETSKINERGTLRSLEKLSKIVGTQLNDSLYKFIFYIETNDDDSGRKKVTASIRKQVISVPSIIYALEQCERNLILISKKAKTIDFMEFFKRSTARDFRIKADLLKSKNLDSIDNNEKQPSKKRKVSN